VWLLIVVALGLIAGLAWLVHRLVERPLTRRLRRALSVDLTGGAVPIGSPGAAA
jgi:peptidoglycan/LPS O-acetylase OafA/YrhL